MSRPVRRSIHLAPAIVACLLLTSCAYITRVSGEFGPATPAVLTFNGDISNDGSIVVFDSTRAFDAGDTNGLPDIIVSDRNNEQIYRLSSAAVAGQAPNASSTAPKVSGNGQSVVWASAATNLVAGDTNARTDIFLASLATGSVEIISRSSTGELGNGTSLHPSISDDGRYVAFSSSATNLVSGDTNGVTDVFVRDTVLGTTTRWSTGTNGGQGPYTSTQPEISGDGETVVFRSVSSFVAGDTNGLVDIYRKSLDGSIIRVSASIGGVEADAPVSRPVVNRDGSVVAFETAATSLDPRDTNGVTDVYVWRGVGAELASLGPNDEVGSTVSDRARLDASGDLVGFSTAAPEITGSASMEGVVRNVAEGRTDVVSSDLFGVAGNGFDTVEAISGNGRFVLVRGVSSNLIDNDTNNAADMFVKSYPQPEITNVTPSVLGGGTTTVTITGRGFAAPMAVILEENPGVNPVVGPVTVIDSKTLTVDITVPRGAVTHQPLVMAVNLGAFVGDTGAAGVCGGCLTIP